MRFHLHLQQHAQWKAEAILSLPTPTFFDGVCVAAINKGLWSPLQILSTASCEEHDLNQFTCSKYVLSLYADQKNLVAFGSQTRGSTDNDEAREREENQKESDTELQEQTLLPFATS